MKRPFVLPLLMLGCIGFAQDLAKPIDYTAPAVPIRVVLEDLSKQAGGKLYCTGDLEDEPVILRLRGVPLQDAMDKIAEIFMADWVKRQDGYRLERSENRVAEVRKRAYDRTVASVKASIDSLVKVNRENTPLDHAGAEQLVKDFLDLNRQRQGSNLNLSQRQFVLNSRLPAMRMAIEMLETMDPQMFAGLPNDERVVFSSDPTPTQRALPPIDPAIFSRFVERRSQMHEAIKDQNPGDLELSFGLKEDCALVTEPLGKILLSATRLSGVRGVQLEFTFIGRSGQVLATDYETVGVDTVKRFEQRAIENQLRLRAHADGLLLEGLGFEIATYDLSRREANRPLSNAAIDALLHPTRVDPLQPIAAQIVLKTAEATGANVACLFSDSVTSWAAYSSRTGKTSLELFRAQLERLSDCSIETKQGWIIGHPEDPALVAETRMPRDTLETFLQEAFEKKSVGLDEAAQLVSSIQSRTDRVTSSIVDVLLRSDSNFVLNNDADTLRVWGGLSPQQQDLAKVKGGIALNIRELSPEQREAVRSMVYNGRHRLSSKPQPTYQFMTEEATPPRDATEELPDGLPLNTTVEVTDSTAPAFELSVSQENGQSYQYTSDPQTFAYSLASLEAPDKLPAYQTVNWAKFGTQRTIVVIVKLREKLFVGDVMAESRMPAGPGIDPRKILATLPTDMQQLLMKQMQEIISRASSRTESVAPSGTSAAKPPARS